MGHIVGTTPRSNLHFSAACIRTLVLFFRRQATLQISTDEDLVKERLHGLPWIYFKINKGMLNKIHREGNNASRDKR